jgi:hypothetical protein
MTLSQKQALFAVNVAKLIDYIHAQGYLVTFGEAYRTPQQAQWDAQSGTGIVNSLHCKRLAIDLNLLSCQGEYISDTAHYEKCGHYWTSLHPFNRWGGTFKTRADGNHFEMQDL